MGAIVIRTRYDKGTESAEVATSVLIAFKKVKPNKDEKILKFIRVVKSLWYASTRHISSPEDRITSIKHCAPRISSKMATIDDFALKNIGLWWRYRISRHCDEWKYTIIGRIFESEIILIPPSSKISESSSNGSYRNTDEVWWRYGISRSCDEWLITNTARPAL